MRDYYKTLGVDRSASAEDIKRAYRRLASQHHPDKGGDKARFQEIQEAYDALSNPERKAAHDNPGFSFETDGFAFHDIFDVFRQQAMAQGRVRAVRMQLWISYRDLLDSTPKTVSVATPQGQANIELSVPGYIEDGESVRYPRLAPGGHDLIVMFRFHHDPVWQHQSRNLLTERTVSIWDLLLGKEIEVVTPDSVTMSVSIPAGTQPGQCLRIRSHGLPTKQGGRGDLMIRLAARLPDSVSPELMEQIRQERDDKYPRS